MTPDHHRETLEPGQIRTRPMNRYDVDALMPYEREMFGTEAWSRGAYLDELADRHDRYYLAAEDGDDRFIGWAGLLVIGETAQILTVGVIPDARRAGVARALLAGLLAETTRRRASEVLLEVRVDNEAACRLYASEGFVELGVRRGYYDAGRVDALTMRKDLS